MSPPLFSIITPSYNSLQFIEDTIESVVTQSLADWEMLIVDDCSSDGSINVIKDYVAKDQRIKLIQHTNNSGVAIARNTAIKKAKGRYIAFLDSDDQWLPNKLESQLVELEKGSDLVFSSYYRFLENENEDENENENDKVVNVPTWIDYKKLLKGNCIGNLTGVYNAERLGKFYQESVKHEDYLMWLNIIRKSEGGVGIQNPLARYRVRSESLSGDKIESAKWTWDIYRKHLKLNFFYAIYCFSSYTFKSLLKRV